MGPRVLPVYGILKRVNGFRTMIDDSDDDEEGLRAKLHDLMTEHRDLDDSINALSQGGSFDQLQIQRLKRKKLLLKDEITKLRARLIPDIIA